MTGLTERERWDSVIDELQRGSGLQAWRAQSDAALGRLLERWAPEASENALKTDLFDEASGTGLIGALGRRSAKVSGIDISAEVVRLAAERNPGLRAVTADVRELPFGDDEFDLVVSNSTLDHFGGRHDVEAALAELHRVMRRGGRLVVTLDNPLNPLIAARAVLPEDLLARIRGVGYGTGWTCGPGTLEKMLVAAGFTVADRTAIVHAPRFLVARLGRNARTSGGEAAGWVRSAEALGRLPTRYLSGHFVAGLGVKG